MLPAWTMKKIVWGGTNDCRISKRGSCGTYHSSWAGSCNPSWDGIILCFHIVCPFVFLGTIWRNKCSLAWVWPCIICITVIVFYSIACGIKTQFWTEYMEMWPPFVSLDLISCSGCSSEDWETRMCLQTDRKIKKQLLLMESGPIYNQVTILFSDSTSLGSYRFRQIWGEERWRENSERQNSYGCRYLLMLLLYPAAVFVSIPTQHSKNKI